MLRRLAPAGAAGQRAAPPRGCPATAAGAPAESLAPHLLAVEPAGEPWVVDACAAAAGGRPAAARRRPRCAYLERALAEPPPRDRPAVTCWPGAGFAAGLQGDPRAIEWLRDAVDAGVVDAAAGRGGRGDRVRGRRRSAQVTRSRPARGAGRGSPRDAPESASRSRPGAARRRRPAGSARARAREPRGGARRRRPAAGAAGQRRDRVRDGGRDGRGGGGARAAGDRARRRRRRGTRRARSGARDGRARHRRAARRGRAARRRRDRESRERAERCATTRRRSRCAHGAGAGAGGWPTCAPTPSCTPSSRSPPSPTS